MKWTCDCGRPLKRVGVTLGECSQCGLVYPQLTAMTPEQALREDDRLIDSLIAIMEGKGPAVVREILDRPYGHYPEERTER